jgi:hypothetical protein
MGDEEMAKERKKIASTVVRNGAEADCDIAYLDRW